LLEGNNSLIAFGLTNVEVSIKKIRRRNTRSDMDAVLNVGFILFLDLIAISINLRFLLISAIIRMPAHEAGP
jgi:hypothetical protein